MKRYIIAALALLSIACTKVEENSELQPSSTTMNITIGEYPSSFGTTRATDPYAKNGWVADDELYLTYQEWNNEDPDNMTQSIHVYSFDGSKWTLDTPITMNNEWENENIIRMLEIEYHPGFHKVYEVIEGDIGWYISKPKNDCEDNDPIYITSEYFTANNLVTSPDHKIVLSNIENTDNATLWLTPYSSCIQARTNRIRINYKPNSEIKVSGENIYSFENPYSLSILSSNYTLTTDEQGNAFVYAYWDIPTSNYSDVEQPTLTITDTEGNTLREVNLPTIGENAPYNLSGTDADGYSPAYQAQAYSITIPYQAE